MRRRARKEDKRWKSRRRRRRRKAGGKCKEENKESVKEVGQTLRGMFKKGLEMCSLAQETEGKQVVQKHFRFWVKNNAY